MLAALLLQESRGEAHIAGAAAVASLLYEILLPVGTVCLATAKLYSSHAAAAAAAAAAQQR